MIANALLKIPLEGPLLHIPLTNTLELLQRHGLRAKGLRRLLASVGKDRPDHQVALHVVIVRVAILVVCHAAVGKEVVVAGGCVFPH